MKDPPRLAIDPDPPRRSCCGGRQPNEPQPPPPLDYNAIKQKIAEAPAADKAKISALLDSECVVLQYKLPSGMVLKDEF